MGLHFSDFFLPSMTLHPNLYPSAHLGKSQCLVKMVSYGITGDVDIDGRIQNSLIDRTEDP